MGTGEQLDLSSVDGLSAAFAPVQAPPKDKARRPTRGDERRAWALTCTVCNTKATGNGRPAHRAALWQGWLVSPLGSGEPVCPACRQTYLSGEAPVSQ